MKVNVTQILKQRNGESLKDNDGRGNVVDATLRNIIISALEGNLESDKNELPLNRYERKKLADKVYDNDEVDLSAENVTLIKERIGKSFTAYVVGVTWDLLEDNKAE